MGSSGYTPIFFQRVYKLLVFCVLQDFPNLGVCKWLSQNELLVPPNELLGLEMKKAPVRALEDVLLTG